MDRRRVPLNPPRRRPTPRFPSLHLPDSVRNKAQVAQNSNERLALAMQQSMRATLNDRQRPYDRVPVWAAPRLEPTNKSVPAGSKAGARGKAGVRLKPKRLGRSGRQVKIVTKRGVGQTKRVKVTLKVPVGMKRKAKDIESDSEEMRESAGDETIEQPGAENKNGVAKGKGKGMSKEYMTAGFYCQNANAKSPHKLINKVLAQRNLVKASSRAKAKGKGKEEVAAAPRKRRSRGVAAPTEDQEEKISFPPMPYDFGYSHLLGQRHDFVLPFDIYQEAQTGQLDGKKRPAPYQKIRGSESNVFLPFRFR